MGKIKITLAENVRRYTTIEVEANDLPYSDWRALDTLGTLLHPGGGLHHAVDPELDEALTRVFEEYGTVVEGPEYCATLAHDRVYMTMKEA